MVLDTDNIRNNWRNDDATYPPLEFHLRASKELVRTKQLPFNNHHHVGNIFEHAPDSWEPDPASRQGSGLQTVDGWTKQCVGGEADIQVPYPI